MLQRKPNKKIRKSVILGCFFSCFLIFSAFKNTQAENIGKLRSPYPVFSQVFLKSQDTNDSINCPSPPAPVHDMEYTSVYTDKSHGVSIVDKKAQKKYKKQISPVKKFEIKIEQWIDKSLSNKTKSLKNTTCALEWLHSWAQQNSLLDGKTTFQGEAIRKWTLATLSSHYIQIKNFEYFSDEKKQEIEDWFDRIAQQTISEYNQFPEKKSRNNNHMFWAAWGVMSAAVATNNQNHFGWATKKYKQALHQIQPDGTLPLELDRQSKAFHYHVFAVSPLVMMAETLEANGIKAYEENSGSLHKLVDRVLVEIETDQKYIEAKTGKQQNLENTLTAGQLAWLEVYHARFEDARMDKLLKKMQPLSQRRIGGNMTRLYGNPIDHH